MTMIVEATGYGGPDVLALVETEPPVPGPGEVLVSVRAAGVNPADVKSYSGAWGTDSAQLPKRLGYEAAGTITAVGEGARGPDGPWRTGDEVIAFRVTGAYATDLVVPAAALTAKPADLGWAEAGGLMLAGAAAVHGLTATAVGEGDTVLIHGGSGGVGLMAIQVAVLRGATPLATASPRKHDLVRSLGGVPITYGDGLLDRVRQAATGGVDAAVDLVGTPEALDVSLAVVADRGRIASLANFDTAAAAGVKVLGSGGEAGDDIRDAARARLARLAGKARLQVLVGATYPLADAARAHTDLLAGHITGKAVLLLPH